MAKSLSRDICGRCGHYALFHTDWKKYCYRRFCKCSSFKWIEKPKMEEKKQNLEVISGIFCCEGCGGVFRDTKEFKFIVNGPLQWGEIKNLRFYCKKCKPPYDEVTNYNYNYKFYKKIPEKYIEVNEDGTPIEGK